MSRSSRSHRFVPSIESMPLRLTPSSGTTTLDVAAPADSYQTNPAGSGMVSNGSGSLAPQNPCPNPN
jgi:hypothetical protein